MTESDQKTAKTFTEIPLSGIVKSIEPVEAASKFMIIHREQTISLFDWEKRNALPFTTTGTIQDHRVIDRDIYFLLSSPQQVVIFGSDDSSVVKIPYEPKYSHSNVKLEVISPGEKMAVLFNDTNYLGELLFIRKGTEAFELEYWVDFLLDKVF